MSNSPKNLILWGILISYLLIWYADINGSCPLFIINFINAADLVLLTGIFPLAGLVLVYFLKFLKSNNLTFLVAYAFAMELLYPQITMMIIHLKQYNILAGAAFGYITLVPFITISLYGVVKFVREVLSVSGTPSGA